MDYQITCNTRGGGTHESITHLGGPAGGGWKLTKADVIHSIEVDGHTFYTEVNGKRAEVGINGTGASRYLQTHADGIWNNNLALAQYP